MELEAVALMQSGDEIHLIKVHEDTELLLQKAFTPLKNPDRRALRRQFLVPDLSVSMARNWTRSWLLSACLQSGLQTSPWLAYRR